MVDKPPFQQPELFIYGQDHSPWVQAVLLGAVEKNYTYRLTAVPPFSVFLKWGVLMPAVKIDDAPWIIESCDILQQLGYEPITIDEKEAIEKTWLGVTQRVGSFEKFFSAASRIRDPHNVLWRRLLNQFFRSFAVLYFYLLLQFVKIAGLRPDPKDFAESFLVWQDHLKMSGGPFIGGEQPGMLDFLLFGMIQCHASIPAQPVQVLRDAPRLKELRNWIASMQVRFRGHNHLYSGIYFEPECRPPPSASALEKIAFFSGLIFMILLWPVTLPLIVIQACRVPRR